MARARVEFGALTMIGFAGVALADNGHRPNRISAINRTGFWEYTATSNLRGFWTNTKTELRIEPVERLLPLSLTEGRGSTGKLPDCSIKINGEEPILDW